MTEQEREELIEAMAKAICDLYKLNPNEWRHWRKECRAALEVAEPVIREECAKIAEETTYAFDFSKKMNTIAAAIREGGREG